jgi:hypothetical protein
MISSYRFCIGVQGLIVFVISMSTTALVHPSTSNQRRGVGGETHIIHTPRTLLNVPVSLSMEPEEKLAEPHAPETLRKKDVVAAISEQLGVSKANADAAVTAVFDVISDVRLVVVTTVVH